MYESKKKYAYGTGRRKSSIARVRVYENGTGSIIINGRDIDEYFGLDTLKLIVRQPGYHRHGGQGGHHLHRRRRRRHRPGRRHPSRRLPGSAVREPRVPHRSEGRRLPDPRPQNEGEKEVRSEGRPSGSSVQQALKYWYIQKSPESRRFRGFSIAKFDKA